MITRRGFLTAAAGAALSRFAPPVEDVHVLNQADPAIVAILEARINEAIQKMAVAIEHDIWVNGWIDNFYEPV